MPPSVSRAIVEPTVLQMPIHGTRCDLAYRSAARVSAVSPDCEMTMTTSSSARRTAFRYRNSDAYSTSTGTLHRDSRMYSPTRPACHDVPHPQMIIRRAARSLSNIVNRAPSGPTSCSIPPSVTPTPDLRDAGRSSGSAQSSTLPFITGEPGSLEMHTRPRMQLSRAVGCSVISLSMKCLYPPFSICSRLPSSASSRGLSD
mmetsp:Transcript_5935/g.19129  ORF Transcript_5935/g.19129 Transcript_5935/m.19129 type:complete len:201 (-) Transcript_5935:233-835(-)